MGDEDNMKIGDNVEVWTMGKLGSGRIGTKKNWRIETMGGWIMGK